jgi:glycosyltransferase involved in cell wall biosynthesis
MVTHDRGRLAEQAIQSYAAQRWSRRELVIVTDGPTAARDALAGHVRTMGIGGVRFIVPAASGLPLGALRNLALSSADGDVVCQWDDDDCSHPDRLGRQLAAMTERGARASFFTDHLQWIEPDRALSWIDWTAGGRVRGHRAMAPGTLMAFRDAPLRYPEEGPLARRGEDSALLNTLYRDVPITALAHEGYMYLYRYHGTNTFPESHHRRMSGFGLPRATLIERRAALTAALAHYPLPHPVVVRGPDGPAFTVGCPP